VAVAFSTGRGRSTRLVSPTNLIATSLITMGASTVVAAVELAVAAAPWMAAVMVRVILRMPFSATHTTTTATRTVQIKLHRD